MIEVDIRSMGSIRGGHEVVRVKRRGLALLVALILAILMTGVGLAQTYSFGVPSLLMDVYVQPDGSARIVYDITFENYGSPIDVIDIGTPNEDYDVDEVAAAINGTPLTDIRPSEYIDVGIEIHLEEYAIEPGETKTLHVEFDLPRLVYADTTNEDYASMQITPTWFDSGSIEGTSDIEIQIITLPGLEPDEVLYQDEPFTDKYLDDQGRVVAVWRFEDVALIGPQRVGISFPRRGLTQVVEITFWDLVGRWLSGAAGVIGAILGICLPIAVPLFIGFVIVRGIVRASKPHYLPPIAQVEGGGIKRGLTAPEAAVILELPLNKILGLVIFGMLEKGLIRKVDEDPLQVEVVEDFRVEDKPDLDDELSRARYRRQVAQQKGTVIHAYEQPFMDLFERYPDTAISKLDVVEPMEALVNGVAAKMEGFDLSDTKDYYQRIVDRAVEQASALGEVEAREAYLDKYLPWVMMNRDYRPLLTVGPYHYWPRWARQTRTAPSVGGGGRSRSSGGAGRSTTTFGDVSSSFAGWAENTMGGMAAAILPTTLSKPTLTSTSSGRSGGSSCACACAGCACACACAGGGR